MAKSLDIFLFKYMYNSLPLQNFSGALFLEGANNSLSTSTHLLLSSLILTELYG
jgi:hypothetical protein